MSDSLLIHRSPTVHQTVFGTDTAPSALATNLETQLQWDFRSVLRDTAGYSAYPFFTHVRSLLLTEIHISTVTLKLDLSVTEGALNKTIGVIWSVDFYLFIYFGGNHEQGRKI